MEFVLQLASRAVTVFSMLLLSVALVSPVYGFDDPPDPCNDKECYPARVNGDGSFRCLGFCPPGCGCSSLSTPLAGGGYKYSCICVPESP